MEFLSFDGLRFNALARPIIGTNGHLLSVSRRFDRRLSLLVVWDSFIFG